MIVVVFCDVGNYVVFYDLFEFFGIGFDNNFGVVSGCVDFVDCDVGRGIKVVYL